MITVEGREQVLLKVSVVEMERNILKQFGVDLNALINSGNFAFAALSDLPFPINVAGKGLLAPFLNGAGMRRPDALPHQRGSQHSYCRAYQRHRRAMAERRQPRARRAPGARGGRPAAHAGRAQPDGDLRRDGEFPRRRRVSDPGRPAARHHLRRVQEIRHRPRLHPGGDVGRPHQPQGVDRGQRALQ